MRGAKLGVKPGGRPRVAGSADVARWCVGHRLETTVCRSVNAVGPCTHPSPCAAATRTACDAHQPAGLQGHRATRPWEGRAGERGAGCRVQRVVGSGDYWESASAPRANAGSPGWPGSTGPPLIPHAHQPGAPAHSSPGGKREAGEAQNGAVGDGHPAGMLLHPGLGGGGVRSAFG